MDCNRIRSHRLPIGFLCLALLTLLSGCSALASQSPPQPELAKTLELFNWPDYMPQSVLDAFEAEYGVHVVYVEFESMGEAQERIRQGQHFDVAVLEQDVIPVLAAEGRLARLDHGNIPNLRNISTDFRNLAIDPDNAYSIPYNWGATGLVVRTDLIGKPVAHWSDLWDPTLTGRVAVRDQPVEVIGTVLLALGLPLNTHDPAHLAAAEAKLIELEPAHVFFEADRDLALPALLSGEVTVLLGWAGDALEARAENPAVEFVLPEEGLALWQDAFTVSSASSKQYTAEVFINFLLRTDIGAQLINENGYSSTNEAAAALADPAIVNEPILYPPAAIIRKSQWYAPMDAATERRYAEIWQNFLDSVPD